MPMADRDEDLILGAQAADMDAFCLLAKRYERRIYSLALNYCQNPQDAEDLSQEAWLKAYQAIVTFRGESSFYTWIRKITINCFLNSERAKFSRWGNQTGGSLDDLIERDKELISAGSETTLHNRILFARVMDAMSELTPRQRLIFLLKYHEGMTYEEIATAIDCSTGTAKKAVARAFAKLREQLQVDLQANDCVPCAAGQY